VGLYGLHGLPQTTTDIGYFPDVEILTLFEISTNLPLLALQIMCRDLLEISRDLVFRNFKQWPPARGVKAPMCTHRD
jgi:hypothetical protein